MVFSSVFTRSGFEGEESNWGEAARGTEGDEEEEGWFRSEVSSFSSNCFHLCVYLCWLLHDPVAKSLRSPLKGNQTQFISPLIANIDICIHLLLHMHADIYQTHTPRVCSHRQTQSHIHTQTPKHTRTRTPIALYICIYICMYINCAYCLLAVHLNRWFRLQKNTYTGCEEWQSTGDYWKRCWDKCPDIYWWRQTNSLSIIFDDSFFCLQLFQQTLALQLFPSSLRKFRILQIGSKRV